MKPDLTDPRWLPIGYETVGDKLRLLRVELELVARSSFLDRRMNASWNDAIDVPAHSIDFPFQAAPALLFHTAFCGSTLLTRALQYPPQVVALREPTVLLSLSTALMRSRSAYEHELIDRRLFSTLSLLSRPWVSDGKVLIKPTNQANNLIGRIARAHPDLRAVLLYSSLKEFMLSCLKKLPESETKIRWMAQHLLVGTRLSSRLGIDPFSRFNLIESCVLTWFAQIEYFADALASDDRDNLRTLDITTLLASPERAVLASANWLNLHASLDNLQSRLLTVFSRNSKSPTQDFSAEKREITNEIVFERYGELIERALEWTRREIEPVATVPRAWKPLVTG